MREDVDERLHDLAVVAGIEMAHVVPVEDVDRAGLSRAEHQVRV